MGLLFELVRKIENKIWITKHGRRSVFAERPISTKKVIIAYFSYVNGIVLEISVPKGKCVKY
jgi:hypothetical protein